MKITDHNVSIHLVDIANLGMTCLFNPFGFLCLDLSRAMITVKIDGKEKIFPWEINTGRIMWMLEKSGRMTNRQIYTKAKIIDGEIVISNCMKVMVYSLSFSCTSEEITSETTWQKEERLETERIRKCFPEK